MHSIDMLANADRELDVRRFSEGESYVHVGNGWKSGSLGNQSEASDVPCHSKPTSSNIEY